MARAGVAVLSVLLVLSIVASVLAVGQRNEAREQARISQARQLAATARSIAGTEIGKARLLAVQAYRLVPELQTEGALLSTLTASPQLAREFDAGSRVWDTAGTADGRRVVAANNAGEIVSWDVATGERTIVGRRAGRCRPTLARGCDYLLRSTARIVGGRRLPNGRTRPERSRVASPHRHRPTGRPQLPLTPAQVMIGPLRR